MKTLKLKLVAMLVVLFATIGLYAQCGEYGELHTVTLTIGDCDYNVEFCLTCAYGPFPAEGFIYAIDKLDPDCDQSTLNISEVINAAEAMLLNSGVIAEYCADIPPCDPNGLVSFEFRTAMCWQSEYIEYYFGDYIRYTPCTGSAECIHAFDACVTNWFGQIIIANETYTSTGTPSCIDEAWEVPEPTIGDPGPTGCYIIHTGCNP